MVIIQFFFYDVYMKISKKEVKTIIKPYIHSRLFNDESISSDDINTIHHILSKYDNVLVQVFNKKEPYVEIIVQGLFGEDVLRYNISSDTRDWIDQLEDIDAFFGWKELYGNYS